MNKQKLLVEKQIDKIRKESIFKTIPELEDVRDMYPGIYEEAYEKFK